MEIESRRFSPVPFRRAIPLGASSAAAPLNAICFEHQSFTLITLQRKFTIASYIYHSRVHMARFKPEQLNLRRRHKALTSMEREEVKGIVEATSELSKQATVSTRKVQALYYVNFLSLEL